MSFFDNYENKYQKINILPHSCKKEQKKKLQFLQIEKICSTAFQTDLILLKLLFSLFLQGFYLIRQYNMTVRKIRVFIHFHIKPFKVESQNFLDPV